MKKLLLLLPLVMALLGCSTASTKQIVIGKKNAAVLTAGNCAIVLAPEASPTAKFAAGELQSFLSQVLGGEISVVAAPSQSKHNLYVGFSKYTAEVGLDPAQLVRDGFFLKSVGNDCYLAGIDDPQMAPETAIARSGVWINLYERGTLFAAYDFLERFAGLRFYFPGELGTIVPQKNSSHSRAFYCRAAGFQSAQIFDLL